MKRFASKKKKKNSGKADSESLKSDLSLYQGDEPLVDLRKIRIEQLAQEKREIRKLKKKVNPVN